MKYVYLLTMGSEWEDTIIFLTKEDAIKQSIAHPKNKVEIFCKNDNCSGYTPTFDYYKNGVLVQIN